MINLGPIFQLAFYISWQISRPYVELIFKLFLIYTSKIAKLISLITDQLWDRNMKNQGNKTGCF